MKATLIGATLVVCLVGASLSAQTPQQQRLAEQAQLAQLQAANQIESLGDRIKEIQRIQAAYPDSSMRVMIDIDLLNAVSLNADTLEKVLAAQGEVIKAARPQDKPRLLETAATMLTARHPKAAEFPKAGVLKAVQGYRSELLATLSNPEISGGMPESNRNNMKNSLAALLVSALIANGDYSAALDALQENKGTTRLEPSFYFLTGEALAGLKRDKEALDAYYLAAVDGHQPSVEKAKALYAKFSGINGTAANFDADLISRRAALPFHPPPFKAPENWQGRAVLAELFTGSECPPCVAADFAFDGLIETYPTKHLVVLVYHLPIPRYDPMMNHATIRRQAYYGPSVITGTPTVVVDGVNKVNAGGYYRYETPLRSFNAIKAKIDDLMGAATEVSIKASAALNGDKVQVDCEFSKVIPNADYNIVLVQGEEIFYGFNTIVSHKMVVRDMATVSPAAKATFVFNIPEGEKTASEFITEWGKTGPAAARIRGSSWPQQNTKVNRDSLKAVVFVQDKETKQIHNSFVVDVKR
ncbi:MAG: hypothetical protein LBC63_01075 [Holophagales bacterium]|jgi:hypothetical protein|nr:hypothetical protein [Holophagales bacterium]